MPSSHRDRAQNSALKAHLGASAWIPEIQQNSHEFPVGTSKCLGGWFLEITENVPERWGCLHKLHSKGQHQR